MIAPYIMYSHFMFWSLEKIIFDICSVDIHGGMKTDKY